MSSASRPAGFFRSRAMLRLLRLACRKMPPMSAWRPGPIPRTLSPAGGSTLMTSAPRSPSICVAYGPINTVVTSRMRTPSKGPLMRRLRHAPLRRARGARPCAFLYCLLASRLLPRMFFANILGKKGAPRKYYIWVGRYIAGIAAARPRRHPPAAPAPRPSRARRAIMFSPSTRAENAIAA
ncbi:Uncharacterised protein [Bordetella pertussis]|nr:Uncharacterised protein [Bordetella pertussis]